MMAAVAVASRILVVEDNADLAAGIEYNLKLEGYEVQVAYDGDTAIAVFNIDGELYAVEDVCTHDGGELAGGPVEGFAVECPRHGAKFDTTRRR